MYKFNEVRFDPIETPVKHLKLNVYNSTTSEPGELRGIEFIDVQGNSMFQIGDHSMSSSLTIKNIELKEDERVIGLISGRRNYKGLYHYDVQFVLGQMETGGNQKK